MIGLSHYLLVGAALFGLGLFGLLTKRNLIAVLMSIELMLNSVNINLVAVSRSSATDAAAGLVFSLFIIVPSTFLYNNFYIIHVNKFIIICSTEHRLDSTSS